ncbi:hypothetical protein GCM10010222_76330 [Streptomyces tanashiensis]|nr:hypothetical protein GCM10010222_76330 [Streptomyces tanashiensis]
MTEEARRDLQPPQPNAGGTRSAPVATRDRLAPHRCPAPLTLPLPARPDRPPGPPGLRPDRPRRPSAPEHGLQAARCGAAPTRPYGSHPQRAPQPRLGPIVRLIRFTGLTRHIRVTRLVRTR